MTRWNVRGLPAIRNGRACWTFAVFVCLLCAGCPSQEAPPPDPAAPASDSPATSAEPTAQTQDAAPAQAGSGEITLIDTTPEALAELLASKKGKVVLVDFWATWCIPCRMNFPHIVEFHKQYAGRGLEVVSVSLDDPGDRAGALEFLKEQGASFDNRISTLGLDSFDAFNITGGSIPHYRLYARDGTLAKTFQTDPTAEQPITAESIEAELRTMLEAQ